VNGNVKSMSTMTTMRDRGDRYGPIEWAQQMQSGASYLGKVVEVDVDETIVW